MAGKKKISVSELRVVFNSSVVYTGSESYLVKKEVASEIKKNSQHPDLNIKWYLTATVMNERQYQMQNKAMELLPSIQKMERLLGHNLNITESIVKQRVREAIAEQIKDLNLNILELDSKEVDVNKLMLDACYRRAPFHPGENERGFRDALIAEAFAQLVEVSPKTPKVCRVVMVAGDEDLREAINERCGNAKNVRILESIDDLKGLINTLIEQVTEEVVAAYREKAKGYFFDVDQEDSIYYKEKIRSKIRKKFKDELVKIPKGSDERVNNQTWHISTPSFIKKEARRVFWSSRIRVDSEAYKWTTVTFPPKYGSTSGTTSWEHISPSSTSDIGKIEVTGIPPDWLTINSGKISGTSSIDESGIRWGSTGNWINVGPSGPSGTDNWINVGPSGLSGPIIQSPTKVLFSKGQAIFEVIWSVTITTTGVFRSPQIESIKHVGTNWE